MHLIVQVLWVVPPISNHYSPYCPYCPYCPNDNTSRCQNANPLNPARVFSLSPLSLSHSFFTLDLRTLDIIELQPVVQLGKKSWAFVKFKATRPLCRTSFTFASLFSPTGWPEPRSRFNCDFKTIDPVHSLPSFLDPHQPSTHAIVLVHRSSYPKSRVRRSPPPVRRVILFKRDHHTRPWVAVDPKSPRRLKGCHSPSWLPTMMSARTR